MTVVYEDLDLPDSSTPWPAQVTVRLAGAQGRPVLGKTISTGKAIIGETILRTGAGIDGSGLWSLDLVPAADIAPSNTTWRIERKVGCERLTTYITVPVTGGPYEAFLLEDDPLGTITPSALEAHKADATLHGGGLELDSAYLTSPVTITGTGGGLTAALVAGSTVTVPDLARPVHLIARVPSLQPSGGPSESSWGIFKSGVLGVFSALDSGQPAGYNTTTARWIELFAELPPFSGGDYVIAGSGASGNFTTRFNPSAISKGSLRAIAA